MKTTKQTLEAARALIADKAHWTQGSVSMDMLDRVRHPRHPAACRWCATGAVVKAAAGSNYVFERCLGALHMSLVGFQSIESFNDTHTHDEVLQLFDAAISKC